MLVRCKLFSVTGHPKGSTMKKKLSSHYKKEQVYHYVNTCVHMEHMNFSLYIYITLYLFHFPICLNTFGNKCMVLHGHADSKTHQASNISNRRCRDGVSFTFTCYETKHLDLSCRQTRETALHIGVKLNYFKHPNWRVVFKNDSLSSGSNLSLS